MEHLNIIIAIANGIIIPALGFAFRTIGKLNADISQLQLNIAQNYVLKSDFNTYNHTRDVALATVFDEIKTLINKQSQSITDLTAKVQFIEVQLTKLSTKMEMGK